MSHEVLLPDLSSSSINFANHSSAFKIPSSVALPGFKSFIYFLAGIVPRNFFFCINSKLALKSTIAEDNL